VTSTERSVNVLHRGGFTRAMGELHRATGLDGGARLVLAVPGFLEVGVHVAQENRGVVGDAQHFVGDDRAGDESVCHCWLLEK
jgi:hypothetical protein